MSSNDFKCILCGGENYYNTGKKPRDRKESDIVVCEDCGHIQMFPLLSSEEYDEEYSQDKSLRFGEFKIADGSDFETMRIKYSEWTKAHADMYFEKMQAHKNVLEIASGYGFFAENLNNRPEKKFNIEGVEIGDFRLQNYVGGTVHNIDFNNDEIPENMLGKYDFIICMHLLEHLPEPVKFLKNIRPLLTDGGEVLFEVPNINCFLTELSPEYKDFMYLYEHVSYYSEDTIRLVFEKAGYNVKKIYTKELYSVENHINWIRTGKPFIKVNQMFLPDERIEFINDEYKKRVGEMGKGFALIIEAE